MLDRKYIAAAAAVLLVGGAAASGGNGLMPFFGETEEAASPWQPRVVRSQTADAVFAGWEASANGEGLFEVQGQVGLARVGPAPLNHFLEAHRGMPITVRVDTVRIAGAGGEQEVEMIADARIGRLTAAAWWAALPSRRQQAIRRRTEEASAGTALVAGFMRAFSTLVPAAAAAQPNTLYVDAVGGSDEQGDGLSAATAFRTIGRAMAQVPTVVDGAWTVHLAAGTYAEAVELRRFLMPSMLSNPQLRAATIPRAIALAGPTSGGGGAVIAPPAGSPCVSAASVVLFLDSLICHPQGSDGITGAGATLVLDDVRIETSAGGGTYGLHAETSLVYLGGTFAVEGPFTIGLAARTNTLARTGTRRNPEGANLTFRGLTSQAIFLRDGGNFTSAFEQGTLRVVDTRQAIYALLGSRVFLNATLRLEMENVQIGVAASQFSSINASQVVLTGPMPNPFVACHKGSYVSLERVTAAAPRPMDTDGTCSLVRY